MSKETAFESRHFTIEELKDGVVACIHKPGGAAYSNAGIIDLGDRTIMIDALNTMTAGSDLRQLAETRFGRPVDTIFLTHPHSDHWIGASAFDASTSLVTTETITQVCLEWGRQIMEDFNNPAEWEEWLEEMENQLQTETDERIRTNLKNTILQTQFTLAEMAEYEPRYADHKFDDILILQGNKRSLEIRSLGRGHSEEDVVALLPQDEIAFIGDVGFFDAQPFMGFCDIDLYRDQLHFFRDSEFLLLVPGHGPIGSKDDIVLQLDYFDVLEELVGDILQKGGAFEDALQITLPDPFDRWQVGGMERFKANVRFMFEYLGGDVPEQD